MAGDSADECLSRQAPQKSYGMGAERQPAPEYGGWFDYSGQRPPIDGPRSASCREEPACGLLQTLDGGPFRQMLVARGQLVELGFDIEILGRFEFAGPSAQIGLQFVNPGDFGQSASHGSFTAASRHARQRQLDLDCIGRRRRRRGGVRRRRGTLLATAQQQQCQTQRCNKTNHDDTPDNDAMADGASYAGCPARHLMTLADHGRLVDAQGSGPAGIARRHCRLASRLASWPAAVVPERVKACHARFFSAQLTP
jgi:hypothetical protein